MAKAQERKTCPVCGKDVAISEYGIINRHNSPKTGEWCIASSSPYEYIKEHHDEKTTT